MSAIRQVTRALLSLSFVINVTSAFTYDRTSTYSLTSTMSDKKREIVVRQIEFVERRLDLSEASLITTPNPENHYQVFVSEYPEQSEVPSVMMLLPERLRHFGHTTYFPVYINSDTPDSSSQRNSFRFSHTSLRDLAYDSNLDNQVLALPIPPIRISGHPTEAPKPDDDYYIILPFMHNVSVTQSSNSSDFRCFGRIDLYHESSGSIVGIDPLFTYVVGQQRSGMMEMASFRLGHFQFSLSERNNLASGNIMTFETSELITSIQERLTEVRPHERVRPEGSVQSSEPTPSNSSEILANPMPANFVVPFESESGQGFCF